MCRLKFFWVNPSANSGIQPQIEADYRVIFEQQYPVKLFVKVCWQFLTNAPHKILEKLREGTSKCICKMGLRYCQLVILLHQNEKCTKGQQQLLHVLHPSVQQIHNLLTILSTQSLSFRYWRSGVKLQIKSRVGAWIPGIMKSKHYKGLILWLRLQMVGNMIPNIGKQNMLTLEFCSDWVLVLRTEPNH